MKIIYRHRQRDGICDENSNVELTLKFPKINLYLFLPEEIKMIRLPFLK